MKKTVLVTLFSLMMLSSASAAVVAKVGTFEITDKDVEIRLQQLPPQYKASYASEAGRKILVEQLVQEKLIYIQASSEKYDTNADVLKQLEKIKQRVMVGQYINDLFEKIEVTENELQSYYDENKTRFVQKEQVRAKHILLKSEEVSKLFWKEKIFDKPLGLPLLGQAYQLNIYYGKKPFRFEIKEIRAFDHLDELYFLLKRRTGIKVVTNVREGLSKPLH